MESTFFQIDPRILHAADCAEQALAEKFRELDAIARYNGEKVLHSFIENRVSEASFAGTSGYGYGDSGRDTLDRVYASVFGTEDALVRFNFVSGTHALSVALFGILRPGDKLVCITGDPYDTLEEIIGVRGESGNGSLKDYGISYSTVSLLPNGMPDLDAIPNAVSQAKVAYIQRSRGYSLRPAYTAEQIGEMVEAVRAGNPDAIVLVDNCYGEFTQRQEPTAYGADLIVGSLIKNAGGAIARTGGYIAGKERLVTLCSYRLTCVGMGKEVGCTLGMNRELYLGLFFAPEVTCNAMKTAEFAAELFRQFGFAAIPEKEETRADIIAAILLGSEPLLTAFCRGIQKGAPIDSFLCPEAWDMPGYDSKVIMAAGAFTMGASIELSADAPIRPPYAVWMQGGITYPSGRMGVLLAAQELLQEGLLNL